MERMKQIDTLQHKYEELVREKKSIEDEKELLEGEVEEMKNVCFIIINEILKVDYNLFDNNVFFCFVLFFVILCDY
jgi:predicted nuclease with TOPRIM domain